MLPMMTMKPATSAQHRSLTLALTLLLTLAGFSLRFYRLSNQSLWTDEISSITTARVPLSQITQQSGEVNNCLPTYFLLLRAVLGDSNQDIEFRARWLSALMGALSVPLLIGVVYLWRQQWAAARHPDAQHYISLCLRDEHDPIIRIVPGFDTDLREVCFEIDRTHSRFCPFLHRWTQQRNSSIRETLRYNRSPWRRREQARRQRRKDRKRRS